MALRPSSFSENNVVSSASSRMRLNAESASARSASICSPSRPSSRRTSSSSLLPKICLRNRRLFSRRFFCCCRVCDRFWSFHTSDEESCVLIPSSSFCLASRSKKTSELFETVLQVFCQALKFVQVELFCGFGHGLFLTRARIKNNTDKVKQRYVPL